MANNGDNNLPNVVENNPPAVVDPPLPLVFNREMLDLIKKTAERVDVLEDVVEEVQRLADDIPLLKTALRGLNRESKRNRSEEDALEPIKDGAKKGTFLRYLQKTLEEFFKQESFIEALTESNPPLAHGDEVLATRLETVQRNFRDQMRNIRSFARDYLTACAIVADESSEEEKEKARATIQDLLAPYTTAGPDRTCLRELLAIHLYAGVEEKPVALGVALAVLEGAQYKYVSDKDLDSLKPRDSLVSRAMERDRTHPKWCHSGLSDDDVAAHSYTSLTSFRLLCASKMPTATRPPTRERSPAASRAAASRPGPRGSAGRTNETRPPPERCLRCLQRGHVVGACLNAAHPDWNPRDRYGALNKNTAAGTLPP
uniref:Uncharacterized protein n=1 Tax=Neobodo designis TaxID=312471 RepID=A0A7S1M6Y4_NEODS